METPKPLELRAEPITLGGLGLSSPRATLVGPKPPVKPPWQRFMDLNWKAIKWIVGNRIVQWAVGNTIWDIFFSRKRHCHG